MTMFWQSTSRSDKGNVRSVNEDSVFLHPDNMLWAVADGMGGYEAGDTASNIVIEELARVNRCEGIDELVRHCQQQLHLASERIKRYSQEQCAGRSVGSTAVCLLATADAAACVWAGDSRLYRLRRSNFERLSTDHSEVAQLVALGHLTEAEARAHPKANVITRTIGVGGDRGTEFIAVDVEEGDTFLLCSDGLYNELDESEICECLNRANIEVAADELVSRTLSTPARDNVSIVVLQHSRV